MTQAFAPIDPLVGRPPDEVLSVLTGGRVKIRRRAEIYEADGITPMDVSGWNARLIDGSVTIDRDRDERRSLDLYLDNTDRALVNDPFNGFWYDKIIKVFWGVTYQINGESKIWETPLGEFMIDRIDEDRFPNAIKVTGRDYTKRCMLTKLPYSLTFQSGTRVEDIIKALGLNCGLTKFALPTTDQAYSDDIVFTRGTERWKVMTQLADAIGYELFFRSDGYLTMRPYPDPTTSPIRWSFNRGAGGSLVDYKRSGNDSRIFNHIIVVGSSVGGVNDDIPGAQSNTPNPSEVIFAEAINNNPASPSRVSRIGDRVLDYESDLFSTAQQAQQYANTQLRISSLEEYTVNITSVILPWLEGSDIVEVQEDDVSEFTPRRFLLSSYTVPLKLGPMTGTARRVTITGTNQVLESY